MKTNKPKVSSDQKTWQSGTADEVIKLAIRKGVLPHHDLVRFALFCAKQNQHLLKDIRSMVAIVVVEGFLTGESTAQDCANAANAASAAADAAADAAAAYAAARKQQADFLRANFHPFNPGE